MAGLEAPLRRAGPVWKPRAPLGELRVVLDAVHDGGMRSAVAAAAANRGLLAREGESEGDVRNNSWRRPTRTTLEAFMAVSTWYSQSIE